MSSVVPPSSTLQVTKVPPDLTNQEFETFFSDFGPLRRCFTVKKTQLGYVQFAFEEDAHKCLAENDGILQVGCSSAGLN